MIFFYFDLIYKQNNVKFHFRIKSIFISKIKMLGIKPTNKNTRNRWHKNSLDEIFCISF